MATNHLFLREIEFESDDYALSVALRNLVLRRPLGRVLTVSELAPDAVDLHLGAFNGGRLLGSLILANLTGKQIKMRQVAVDPGAQGQGVGRRLVEFSEAEARAMGGQEMVLNARETAVPFYQRLGYQVVGEKFTQVTLPHIKMMKSL